MVSPPTLRASPGFDGIYQLDDPNKRGHFVGQIAGTIQEANALLAGLLLPTSPIQVHWFMGRQIPSDFIWTSSVSPLIVSARVVALLHEHAVTGWSTYPVEVMNRDGELLEGYQGLSVLGRCGRLQRERRVPVEKQYPAGTFTVYRGHFFEPSSWDGSDIFMPEADSLFVFVVDRVQKAFRKAKITNVAFERADLAERQTR
jgi:hypothetical protein